MAWVKLCGMTRREDVDAAVAAGADAVGFVVYDGSPRRVPIGVVPSLTQDVAVARFLVTVDADPEWLVRTAAACGVSGVQPHGAHATDAALAALAVGLDVLFPIPVHDDAPVLDEVPEGSHPLLDTGGTGLHGGSGTAFDWSLARADREVVIAGGLTAGNVADAIRISGAWGVDVASGIESAPGIKDHEAMRQFVEEAR